MTLDEIAAVKAKHEPDGILAPVECKGCRADCLYCEGDHLWPCDTYRLAVEAERLAGQVVRDSAEYNRAAAGAWDHGYQSARLGIQRYHNPHVPHRNEGSCPDWCTPLAKPQEMTS